LPPLLLEPDEAVAMAVCLRLAAGGSVAGVGESALRALSKLDQVMPPRMRSQVAAVCDSTVMLTAGTDGPVERELLMTLARACRDHEHVDTSYIDRAGNVSDRRLEPYQLVTTGRRWYLLAFDRDQSDWRSLRLGRMSSVRAWGTTFAVRDAPDAATYVSRSISSSPYRYVARVRYDCSEDVVAQHFSSSSVTIEACGDDSCFVTTGADDPAVLALFLAMVGRDFAILEPPEVIDAARAVAARLQRSVP
jgi:predicted DNA-binding transcriptional regulator YafY